MQFAIEVPDDLSALSSDEATALKIALDQHIGPLVVARKRVAAIADISGRLAAIAGDYLDARDGPQPLSGKVADWPAWRQPTGAHDAYPSGRVIRWTDGHLYRATRSGVVHTPAESITDWADVTDELAGTTPPPTPEADPWDATATYKYGALVAHNGKTWRCISAHGPEQQGQWKPGAAWTVWELVA